MTYEYAEGYKIRNQEGLHFLTFTIEGWVDIFSRQRYRDILVKNMQVCREKKGLLNGAYCIMSNHMHVIWRSAHGDLSGLIRDFKSFTSKEIIRAIHEEPESRRDWLLHMLRYYAKGTITNKEFKLWTNSNHPEEIFTEDFLRTKLHYIHENPVRAGLVLLAEHYLYSSAANYHTGKGLIEIDFLF